MSLKLHDGFSLVCTLPTEVVLLTGSGRGDCGYLFEVGQNYLVYAYGPDVDHLGTNICQRTAPLSAGGGDLKILGRPCAETWLARDDETQHSLDRSGGRVFRIKPSAAKVA